LVELRVRAGAPSSASLVLLFLGPHKQINSHKLLWLYEYRVSREYISTGDPNC
jgi:hypothetical protein